MAGGAPHDTMPPMLTTLLLFACASEAPAPPAVAPAAPAAQAPAPVAPAKVDLASFAAVSDDGSPRDMSHLRGHPTVVWFYPKAATGG